MNFIINVAAEDLTEINPVGDQIIIHILHIRYAPTQVIIAGIYQ